MRNHQPLQGDRAALPGIDAHAILNAHSVQRHRPGPRVREAQASCPEDESCLNKALPAGGERTCRVAAAHPVGSWPMKYRKLGDSGLLVSEIGFGSWLTFTESAAQATRDLVRASRARSRDQFPGYGERLWSWRGRDGSWRSADRRQRESYVLATKLFFPMSSADRGLSRDADPKSSWMHHCSD